MNKRRVVLRADASKKTGYGHFFRSLALANHLKGDFDCCFASYNTDQDHLSRYQITEIFRVCEPFFVKGSTLDEYGECFLEQLLPSDIVVLDNYYFTTDFQRKIKGKGCRLVCIDDMHDRHMVCDVLITGSPLKRNDFSLEPYTIFKGGLEWIFLREAFLKPLPARTTKEQIQNIVISMGGSDAFDLTNKMIDVIRDVLPDTDIEVIAGETVRFEREDNEGININRKLSAEEIARLFDNADLGIFPASTVGIEALSRSLPIFAGHYVDNQKALYDYGVNKGYFAPLGCLLDPKESISARLKNALRQKLPIPQVTCFQDQKERTLELFKSII